MDFAKEIKRNNINNIITFLEEVNEYTYDNEINNNPFLAAIKFECNELLDILFTKKQLEKCSEDLLEKILIKLCRAGMNDYLMYLLSYKKFNQTQLRDALLACTNSGDQMTVQLLLDSGLRINNDCQSIENAIWNRNYDIAFLLLSKLDSINIFNNNNENFLHHVATSGYNPLLSQYLIFNGLDVNKQDNRGFTPLMNAILSIELDGDNHFFEISQILIRSGANPNVLSNDGYTALMYACKFSDYLVDGNEYLVEYMKFLLDNGAQVNLKNNKGISALDVAREHKFTEAVDLLLEYVNKLELAIPNTVVEGNKNATSKINNYPETSFLRELGYTSKLSRGKRWEILQNEILIQYSKQEVINKLTGFIKRFSAQRNGKRKYAGAIAEWEYDIKRLKTENIVIKN